MLPEIARCCLSVWSLETLRPLRGQPVAVLVQIHQREGRTDPLVVFPDAPIAHLYESEDTLENAERMLHFGSNPCGRSMHNRNVRHRLPDQELRF